MKKRLKPVMILSLTATLTVVPGHARKPPVELAGVSCQNPPPLHCWLGPTPPIPASFFAAAAGNGAAAPPGKPSGAAGLAAAMAPLPEPPAADFSFIFETGEHELGDRPIPDASPRAAKYGCGARVRRPDVVDTKPGYVYDSTRQNPGSDAWGRLPRPGTAEVFEYPKCRGGRVVADVVRMGKGHTEGLEPRATEELVKLMLSAKK